MITNATLRKFLKYLNRQYDENHITNFELQIVQRLVNLYLKDEEKKGNKNLC